jgi:arylsulfatase A-like enzyme
LDIAGEESPRDWPGRVVTDTLKNRPGDQGAERSLFWNIQGNQAIRKGKWKAILANGYDEWELYDVENDRTEINDLAQQQPDRVTRLVDEWQAWNQQRRTWGE